MNICNNYCHSVSICGRIQHSHLSWMQKICLTLRICEIKNEKKFNKKPRNSNHELLLLQMLVEKSINCNTSRSSRWAGGQSATSFKICKMNQFEIRKIHKFVAALDISTQQKHFRWSSVNCCVIYDIYLLREWVWKETLLLILSFFFLFFQKIVCCDHNSRLPPPLFLTDQPLHQPAGWHSFTKATLPRYLNIIRRKTIWYQLPSRILPNMFGCATLISTSVIQSGSDNFKPVHLLGLKTG